MMDFGPHAKFYLFLLSLSLTQYTYAFSFWQYWKWNLVYGGGGKDIWFIATASFMFILSNKILPISAIYHAAFRDPKELLQVLYTTRNKKH